MDERPLTPTMINLNIGIEVQLKYTLFSTDHYPNFSFPLKLSHLKVLIEKKKKNQLYNRLCLFLVIHLLLVSLKF